MADITSIFLLLNATVIRHNPDQLNYAATTIEQYMHHRGGHCLFLDTSGGHYKYDNFMNEILLHPKTVAIPRIILNERFEGPHAGGFFPSLLLVEGDAKLDIIFHHFIDNNTPTLLFGSTTGQRHALILTHMTLMKVKITYVAVISTDEKRVLYLKWAGEDYEDLLYPPAIEVLFRYQVKDTIGYNFDYSMRQPELGSYSKRSPLIGAKVHWIDETARYLNGSSTYKPHNCHKYSKIWSACYRSFLIKNQIDCSLEGAVLADKELYFTLRMLPLSIPKSIVLLVPEPEFFTKAHLIAITLNIGPASLLVALILITELIVLFMPVFTIGDPLLYELCGTIPSDIIFAKRTEKSILMALMITIHIISHEFKAHLKAWTIHRPFANHTINTVDQLLSSDIAIICDLSLHPEMRTDDQFKTRITHDSETHVRMDGQQAYFVDYELAPLLVKLKINYDHRYGRRRYRQLWSSYYANVQYRVVLPMTPFMRKFAYTEKVFFESGIWQHWNEEHRWMIDEGMWKQFGGKVETSDAVGGSLTAEDLTVAWLTLAEGIGLGVLVLGVENLFFYCF